MSVAVEARPSTDLNADFGGSTQREALAPLAPRVRFLGLATGLVFLLGWIINFAPWNDLLDKQGTPLGGDYCMFFLGGQIVADGEVARLYDLNEHHERLRNLFPSLGKEDLLPYRYPPFVAGVTAPLARLPFAWSWGIFAACSLGLAAGSWFGLQRWQPAESSLMRAAAVALCGWPVAVEVFVGGQASFLALAIAVATVLLIDKKHQPWAGAVLALALYKPNVLILFVLGCLLRFPRLLWGFVPMTVVLAIGCLATAGWEGCLNYAQLGQSLVQTSWDIPTPFWKIHGLISWFDFWFPTWGRPIVLAAGLAAVSAWLWCSYRRPETTAAEQRSELALLVTLNALFNPYPPLYDLCLLALPAWISIRNAETALRGRRTADVTGQRLAVAVAAGLFFFGPHFSQALSWQLHGQVFTIALLAWSAWQWRQTFWRTDETTRTAHRLAMANGIERVE